MMTIDQLTSMAGEAGRSQGTAAERIADAIESAAKSGYVTYDSDAVKAMRSAYVTGCKASAAPDDKSQARAKAAGHNMFSRAWDSMVGEHGICERPGRGTGRNAGKAKAADANSDASEVSDAKVSREITLADVPAKLRKEIEKAAVKAFLESAKLGAMLASMAESKECFADALKSLDAIGKLAGKAGDTDSARLAKAGANFVKDAGHAFAKLGRGLESTLKTGGVDVVAAVGKSQATKVATQAAA